MARAPLTIIATIWRLEKKNLHDTPSMELPLVNESQDLNSNPDARVRELSGERPLVVRTKMVIETSCTSLVIQKSSCLWPMLFRLSYSISWIFLSINCIYHGRGLRGCALTWSSLAMPIQVNPCTQDHFWYWSKLAFNGLHLYCWTLLSSKMWWMHPNCNGLWPLPQLHPGITWGLLAGLGHSHPRGYSGNLIVEVADFLLLETLFDLLT